MTRRARLDRLERNIGVLRPSAAVVRAAMQRFRETGELPEDIQLAKAVTSWAECGVNEADYGDDRDSQAALIRLYVQTADASRDLVMNGLYEDAVTAPEPGREIARTMLRVLANAGLDPSTPLWLKHGWPVPKMTCNSMAMTLAGFPTRFVHRRHRPRAKALVKSLRAYGAVLGQDDIRIEEYLRAIDQFRGVGEVPDDHAMREAVLMESELTAYVRLRLHGEDSSVLLAALEKYWQADRGDRQAALAEVCAATSIDPTRADPSLTGRRPHLLRSIRWFIRDATDRIAAAEDERVFDERAPEIEAANSRRAAACLGPIADDDG